MSTGTTRFVDYASSPRIEIAIVCLGVAIRAIVAIALRRLPLADDALDYHMAALDLLHGRMFDSAWPPGVPLMLAAAYSIAGSSILTARLSMVFGYLALSLVLRRWLRDVIGRPAPALALAALAIYPSWVAVSVTPLTQLPAALFLVLAIARLQSAQAASWRTALTIGLALAALVLTRPSALVLAGVGIGWLAFRCRRLSIAATAAAALVLPVLVWTTYTSSVHGRRVLINDANAQNLYYGNNTWTPIYRTWWFGSHKVGERGVPAAFVAEHLNIVHSAPAEQNRLFTRAAIAAIEADPGAFAARTASRIRTFLAYDVTASTMLQQAAVSRRVVVAAAVADAAVYSLLVVAALLFMFAHDSRAEGPWRAMIVLVAAGVLYAVPYFIAFSHPTYHMPVAVLLLLPASAVGATWIRKGPVAASRWSVSRSAAAGAALASFLAIQIEWTIDLLQRM